MSEDNNGMSGRKEHSNNKRKPPSKYTSSVRSNPEFKVSQMGRRRFVQFISGLGVSAVSLSHFSKEAVAEVSSDPTNEIPILKKIKVVNPEQYADGLPNKPLETEEILTTVPRDKWTQVETAHQAAKDLQRKIEDRYGHPVAATSVRTDRNSGKEIAVKVGKASSVTPAKLEEDLPDQITGQKTISGKLEETEGINIVFEQSDFEPTVDDFNNRYRPVPGGAGARSYPTRYSPNYAPFTTCMPVYQGSSRYMLTAGHVFDDGRTRRPHTYQWRRGVGGNYFGYEHDYIYQTGTVAPRRDAGLIDPDVSLTAQMAEDGGGYRLPIGSILSWDYVRIQEGNRGFVVTKQGQSSGTQTGYIEDVDPTYYRLFTTAYGEGGDSGGPIYQVEDSPGVANMIGLVTARQLSTSNTLGHHIEWALDYFNAQL